MSTINGTPGNDNMTAVSGNEYYAGDGVDILTSNFSSYTGGIVLDMRGWSWARTNDTNLFYQGQFERLNVLGSEAGDVFYGVTSTAYDDTVRGGGGNDYIDVSVGGGVVDGGAGNDTLVADFRYIDPPGDTGVLFNAAVAAVKLELTTILTQTGFENFTLWGSVSNDTLIAGAGDDYLYGVDGNDLLNMGTGHGEANGGPGNDTLVANFAPETRGVSWDMSGWSRATSGTRHLVWQQEIENFNVVGSNFNDSFTTGAGNDTLDGGNGNDWINMGRGRGIASGGLGSDTLAADFSADTSETELGIVFNAAAAAVKIGAVTVMTQSGFENFRITGTTWNDNIVASGGTDVLSGLGGNDLLNLGTGRGEANGGEGVDTLVASFANMVDGVSLDCSGWSWATSNSRKILWQQEIESFNLTGSSGNDALTGAGANDTLLGGDGNDWINMGRGRGIANGGLGSDTLAADFANEAARVVFAQATANVMAGAAVALNQTGFEHFRLSGTAANDSFATGSGNDTIYGGAGNDLVNGGTGSGEFNGGGGTDTLVASFADASGAVRLDARGWSWGTVSGYNEIWQQEFEVFNLTGSSHDDVFYGAAGNDTLIGGEGNDYLHMMAGRGTASGGAGDDTLGADLAGTTIGVVFNAAAANATSGTTVVLAQTGFEHFSLGGTEWNDTISTGAGDDSVWGGAGNDVINAGTGAGEFNGGAGTDTLVMSFADLIRGVSFNGNGWSWASSGGRQVLWQQEFERFNVTGTAYADNLQGAGSYDTLSGAGGATLGRNQIDTLTGNGGVDLFVLGSTAGRHYDDANTASAGRGDYALITDFTAGTDRLQLKGVASEYSLAPSGITGLSGTGLWHEDGATDELIAVIRSANTTTLTAANTIANAVFV